jgi:hypothetical protein
MTGLMTDHTTAALPPTAPQPACEDLRPVAVVRLPVDGRDWADNLPPVPQGHRASVSFTQAASWAHHGPVLERLGYRVVAADEGAAGDGEWVDMVVYDDLPVTQPSWWRAVTSLAERVLPLAFGPARMACADVLATHQPGRR